MSVLEDSCHGDYIYLHHSNAFDRINHSLLIAKLDGYGVSSCLLSWLDSYLRNRTRTLIVKYNDSTSMIFIVFICCNSRIPFRPSFVQSLYYCHNIYDSDLFLVFANDIKIFGNVSSV